MKKIQSVDKLLEEKAKDYGDPIDYFSQLAQIWGAMLGKTISTNQVVAMYVAAKALRGFNKPDHYDSFLDVKGYGEIGCNLINEIEENEQVY